MKASAATTTIVATLLVLAGGLVGYIIGRSSVPESDVVEAAVRSRAGREESLREHGFDDRVTPGGLTSTDVSHFALRDRLSNFEARVARAHSFESDRRQAYEVERLFENLTLEEAPAILEKLKAVSDPRQRRGLLRPFFVRWAQLDGPAAMAEAAKLEGFFRANGISAALTGWAKKDPYAAWEAAEAYTKEGSRYVDYYTRGALGELAKHDLDAALAVLNAETNQFRLMGLNNTVINAAFEADQVEMLVGKVGLIEDAEQREKWISDIFNSWGGMDTEAPLAALASLDDPALAKGAMEGFIQGWAQVDPDGALNYAFDHREDALVEDALGPLLQQVVGAGSTTENRALAERISEAGFLDDVASDFVSGLSFSNPALALEVASKMTDAEQQSHLRRNVLGFWAQNDFSEAKTYFDQLPQSPAKADLVPALVWPLSRRADGGELVAELLRDVPAGPERVETVEAMLNIATHPGAKSNEGYVAAVKAIVAEEAGLSEAAEKNRAKLLGEVTP